MGPKQQAQENLAKTIYELTPKMHWCWGGEYGKHEWFSTSDCENLNISCNCEGVLSVRDSKDFDVNYLDGFNDAYKVGPQIYKILKRESERVRKVSLITTDDIDNITNRIKSEIFPKDVRRSVIEA